MREILFIGDCIIENFIEKKWTSEAVARTILLNEINSETMNVDPGYPDDIRVIYSEYVLL